MASTIFALATPPGRSGIAVVRVSGPNAWVSLKSFVKNVPVARTASLCVLRNPSSGEVIDRSVVLAFKGPASFTGEDVVEYYVHGGRAVIDSLLSALGTRENHRLAEPGEFTRRAFENGKLDLTAAEAVADLINAETELQKQQALSQMEGHLSKIYNTWTERLKKSLAHIEADIEFPDEDLPGGIAPAISVEIQTLAAEVSAHLDDNRRGERLRDGIHVAVIGAPNAGKSSLVNALAQRDVAIVADMPGTTRDIIEVHLDLGGYPVILSDTAGLRPEQINESGHDAIESEGIRRALARAREADIKILVFDFTGELEDGATLALADENSIMVFNKTDCHARVGGHPAIKPDPRLHGGDIVRVSAKTGAGLDTLIHALTARIQNIFRPSGAPSLTRQRHRAALTEANEGLSRALTASLPELMAEDMRLAIRALGRITGKVTPEDLLDVIFRDFCVGK